MTDLEWWEANRTNSPMVSCPYRHDDKANAWWNVEIAPIFPENVQKVLKLERPQVRIIGNGKTFAEALQSCRQQAEPYGMN